MCTLINSILLSACFSHLTLALAHIKGVDDLSIICFSESKALEGTCFVTNLHLFNLNESGSAQTALLAPC